MVILFADKKTNAEKEIFDILHRCGAGAADGITFITDYGKAESGVPVITCGMNPKSTVTLSSLTSSSALVSLQRTVTDIFGNDTEPCELGIKLNRGRSPFAVTASAAVLLLAGITPAEF